MIHNYHRKINYYIIFTFFQTKIIIFYLEIYNIFFFQFGIKKTLRYFFVRIAFGVWSIGNPHDGGVAP